jgi:D-aminoacyl-tRNA deacylase
LDTIPVLHLFIESVPVKVLLQRVNSASVTVNEERVGAISKGVLLLVGFGATDTGDEIESAYEKIVELRIFPDERGRFHHSLLDIHGDVLLVSQFTLYADTSKGRRPSFSESLAPADAAGLFDRLVHRFRQGEGLGLVAQGVFGAHMKVHLENDGPVTILLEFSSSFARS